jgi:putative endonuclease
MPAARTHSILPLPTAARQLGNDAEQEAACWLATHGYDIVARNVVLKHGELDIVARKQDEVIFVEVKARRGTWPPEEAITPAKQRTLVRTATLFMQNHNWTDLPARFDVITLNYSGANAPVLRHHVDAFRA